jgi:hypothetical protein
VTLREAVERLGRETHDISDDVARGDPEGEHETYAVTVDLDDADGFDVIRAYRTLVEAGAEDVAARVSSGGEGAHVRGWIDADPSVVEAVRYAAGDHPRRTFMDRTHVLKPTNITFTRKPDGEAGPWRSDPWRAVDDLERRSERFGPRQGWPP